MVNGVIKAAIVVLGAISAVVYIDRIRSFTGIAPRLEKQYWGDGIPKPDDLSIKPFKVNFPKEVLDDLAHRLNNTRPFHPPLDEIRFQYGFNTQFLQTVLDFWKNKYNWASRQVYLNFLPQFTTQVQGLNIHFIHAKPTKREGLLVIPLLLVHGWPGSVREFYSLIPLLTTPRAGQNFVFEVIAPSVPGYGFSQATNQTGLGPAQIAVIFHSLMDRLGYRKFYVQGGDWGSIIVTNLAQSYPESVAGLHTNMAYVMPTFRTMATLLFGKLFPNMIGTELEQKFTYPMSDNFFFLLEESGYMHLQSTKPDTIGVALRDSPMGLAAYILEKFSTWTNPSWKFLPDGGLLKKYKMEDLLDNVMIYWLTGSITTSMRLYSENFNWAQRSLGFENVKVKVPTAIARFPNEITNQPRCILEMKFKNLLQLTDMPTGGHFAAFEEPKLLADDIWAFVNTHRSSRQKH